MAFPPQSVGRSSREGNTRGIPSKVDPSSDALLGPSAAPGAANIPAPSQKRLQEAQKQPKGVENDIFAPYRRLSDLLHHFAGTATFLSSSIRLELDPSGEGTRIEWIVKAYTLGGSDLGEFDLDLDLGPDLDLSVVPTSDSGSGVNADMEMDLNSAVASDLGVKTNLDANLSDKSQDPAIIQNRVKDDYKDGDEPDHRSGSTKSTGVLEVRGEVAISLVTFMGVLAYSEAPEQASSPNVAPERKDPQYQRASSSQSPAPHISTTTAGPPSETPAKTLANTPPNTPPGDPLLVPTDLGSATKLLRSAWKRGRINLDWENGKFRMFVLTSGGTHILDELNPAVKEKGIGHLEEQGLNETKSTQRNKQEEYQIMCQKIADGRERTKNDVIYLLSRLLKGRSAPFPSPPSSEDSRSRTKGQSIAGRISRKVDGLNAAPERLAAKMKSTKRKLEAMLEEIGPSNETAPDTEEA